MTKADAIAQAFEEVLSDAENPPDGLVIFRQNRRPAKVDRMARAINIFKVREDVDESGGRRIRKAALRIRLRLLCGDTEGADSVLEDLREWAVAAVNAGRSTIATAGAVEFFEAGTDWDGDSADEADYEFADVDFIAKYVTERCVL